jgi:hypothetical protein
MMTYYGTEVIQLMWDATEEDHTNIYLKYT